MKYIRTKDRAFEIIKKKNVGLVAFVRDFVEGHDNYNEYYENADEYHYYRKDKELRILTQKDFYTLKRALL